MVNQQFSIKWVLFGGTRCIKAEVGAGRGRISLNNMVERSLKLGVKRSKREEPGNLRLT